VVVTIFEGSLLTLAFVGLGVPAWIFSVAVFQLVKKPGKGEVGGRYFAYVRIMDRLLDELNSETNRAPILVATIRELRRFPEYKDVSILFLEEVSVHGADKFDRVVEAELKVTEAALLGSNND
jgi:hypothetical protein